MPYLTITTRSSGPRVHALEGARCTIGRGASNDVDVDDEAVSRDHLELVRQGRAWHATDRGSRNGTLLNDAPLADSRPLEPGDVIELGETSIRFHAGAPKPCSAAERDTAELSPRRTGAVIGEAPAFRRALDLVERVAPRDVDVLITGESGTGKEVLARLIHDRSGRADGPFRTVNCPALSPSLLESELFGVEAGVATGVDARPGHVELAEGGTVFLDELGDLERSLQAKLLRLVQERTYERVGGREPRRADVRFVAATNMDLEAAVGRGDFREDLYFRLAVFPIELPPLRERREDVVPLARHFLREAAPGAQLTEAAGLHLVRLPWPGNVRQLANVMKRAAILATDGVVDVADLPPELHEGSAATDGDLTVRDETERARRLLDAIVARETSFDRAVKDPFLRRELSKDCVRAFVVLALQRGDGSYKGMAHLLGIESEHKRLLDWLRHHGLQPGRPGRADRRTDRRARKGARKGDPPD